MGTVDFSQAATELVRAKVAKQDFEHSPRSRHWTAPFFRWRVDRRVRLCELSFQEAKAFEKQRSTARKDAVRNQPNTPGVRRGNACHVRASERGAIITITPLLKRP